MKQVNAQPKDAAQERWSHFYSYFSGFEIFMCLGPLPVFIRNLRTFNYVELKECLVYIAVYFLIIKFSLNIVNFVNDF